MAAKKIDAPREIYQIKVTLRGTTPPIWRRLLVPADMTLERLHDVLQVAIGWEDCHLHEFRVGQQRFGQPDADEMFTGGPPTRSERTTRLFTVLGRKGAKVVYTYDFGDDWEHNITVEKVLTPVAEVAYPTCTGGARHGPPEDCGGVYGYFNLLQILRDPDHDDPDDLLEWIGEDYDPEAFSIDGVNRSLARFQRRRTIARASAT